MECGRRHFRENRIKMQVTGVSYLCGFSEVAKVSGSTVGAAVKEKIYLLNVREVSYCVQENLDICLEKFLLHI